MSRKPKGDKPKKKVDSPNTVRIQIVLNRKYFREEPAVQVYDGLMRKPDWTARKIVTEGLIALGEKLIDGFEVADVPNEVRISSELLLAFDRLSAFANMITNMDITQLRQVQGFDETVYHGVQADGLKRGAARMLSDDTQFEDEGDF